MKISGWNSLRELFGVLSEGRRDFEILVDNFFWRCFNLGYFLISSTNEKMVKNGLETVDHLNQKLKKHTKEETGSFLATFFSLRNLSFFVDNDRNSSFQSSWAFFRLSQLSRNLSDGCRNNGPGKLWLFFLFTFLPFILFFRLALFLWSLYFSHPNLSLRLYFFSSKAIDRNYTGKCSTMRKLDINSGHFSVAWIFVECVCVCESLANAHNQIRTIVRHI